MTKVLNEKQQKFMAVLFDGANGDVVTAKKMAGYADTTATSDVIKGLKDEIAEVQKIKEDAEYSKDTGGNMTRAILFWPAWAKSLHNADKSSKAKKAFLLDTDK